MPALDPTQTVAAVVLDHSECAEVFQRHHIDFCCRGDLSISAAARARGLDADALLAELSRAIAERNGGAAADVDPRSLSTPRLVAMIVSRHHEYLRRALPFVHALATKVARVHGDKNSRLRDLETAVAELDDSLLAHLDDEEETLFPALTASAPDRARAAHLLAAMLDEHLQVAALLERIRIATEDFTLPGWACNSYRTLFSELRRMESDIFTHVHLENHVLRPRFVTPTV